MTSFSGHPDCDPAHDPAGLHQQSGRQAGGSCQGSLNICFHFRYFLILATVGHLSLLPLLFTEPELLSKLLLLASYSLVLAITLYRQTDMLGVFSKGGRQGYIRSERKSKVNKSIPFVKGLFHAKFLILHLGLVFERI
mgnify:CR=1 FL=1